jgi:hypothetical protein
MEKRRQDGLLPTVVSPGAIWRFTSTFAAILERCGIGMDDPGLYGGQHVPADHRAR